jgi:hypothetical protein
MLNQYPSREQLSYLIQLSEAEYRNDVKSSEDLLKKDRAARREAVEKARRVRPAYLPLHYSLGSTGAGVNGDEQETKRYDNWPITITAANHNIVPLAGVGGGFTPPPFSEDNGGGHSGTDISTTTFTIHKQSTGRNWFSTPSGVARRGTPSNYGTYKGEPLNWPSPTRLRSGEQLFATLYSSLTQPQEADFVLHGFRVVDPASSEAKFDADEAKRIDRAIRGRETPEPRVLAMDVPFTTDVASETVDGETREQIDEPLLVYGMQHRSLDYTAILNIRIEDEEGWTDTRPGKQLPMQLFAASLNVDHPERPPYFVFKRPFYLPSKARILANLRNNLTTVTTASQAGYNGAGVLLFLATTL